MMADHDNSDKELPVGEQGAIDNLCEEAYEIALIAMHLHERLAAARNHIQQLLLQTRVIALGEPNHAANRK